MQKSVDDIQKGIPFSSVQRTGEKLAPRMMLVLICIAALCFAALSGCFAWLFFVPHEETASAWLLTTDTSAMEEERLNKQNSSEITIEEYTVVDKERIVGRASTLILDVESSSGETRQIKDNWELYDGLRVNDIVYEASYTYTSQFRPLWLIFALVFAIATICAAYGAFVYKRDSIFPWIDDRKCLDFGELG